MKIYRNLKWFVFEAEYFPEGRKSIGGSLCPFGWDYPWITVYLFGLLLRFRAQFILQRIKDGSSLNDGYAGRD